MSNDVKYVEVPFEVMLKCDGPIKCIHSSTYNSINMVGVDLRKPMMFSEFLELIGRYLTSMQCSSIFTPGIAKWYVIDDGIQPYEFMKKGGTQ